MRFKPDLTTMLPNSLVCELTRPSLLSSEPSKPLRTPPNPSEPSALSGTKELVAIKHFVHSNSQWGNAFTDERSLFGEVRATLPLLLEREQAPD